MNLCVMHFYPVEKQLSHMRFWYLLHCRAMKALMRLTHQSLLCSHIIKSMDEDEDQNETLVLLDTSALVFIGFLCIRDKYQNPMCWYICYTCMF